MKPKEQIIAEAIELRDARDKFSEKNLVERVLINFPDAIHLGGNRFSLAGYEFISIHSGNLKEDTESILTMPIYSMAEFADWVERRQAYEARCKKFRESNWIEKIKMIFE